MARSRRLNGDGPPGRSEDGHVHPPVSPEQLYDARRQVFYAKPLWRGWMHLAFFELSLVCGTLLVVWARGSSEIIGAIVYAVTLGAMFGVSALYHRGRWAERSRVALQRLDHLMIFLMIAGTSTPIFLVAAPGPFGITCLIIVWSLTAMLSVTHLTWMNAPDRLVGGSYIGLGAVAAAGLPAIWIHAGTAAGILMIAGGVLYIVGAVSYYERWPDVRPTTFGYHEFFHTYVSLAATCHFVAIALLITS
ncbi:hemolysin III [Nakamurella panacisegetis]|uniref:Hemolysin III n=1 Tax=Nakamurella panacisegetis TaxID=1090615 RepID=A0A1H0LLR9_9ACTN|nr:hemolysin III family protein [Nakamurella panacisegetis]SDO68921.1 hemolysin III [Nakamurella panacisegetis]